MRSRPELASTRRALSSALRATMEVLRLLAMLQGFFVASDGARRIAFYRPLPALSSIFQADGDVGGLIEMLLRLGGFLLGFVVGVVIGAGLHLVQRLAIG